MRVALTDVHSTNTLQQVHISIKLRRPETDQDRNMKWATLHTVHVTCPNNLDTCFGYILAEAPFQLAGRIEWLLRNVSQLYHTATGWNSIFLDTLDGTLTYPDLSAEMKSPCTGLQTTEITSEQQNKYCVDKTPLTRPTRGLIARLADKVQLYVSSNIIFLCIMQYFKIIIINAWKPLQCEHHHKTF